jgi:hypothetical protein
MTTQEIYKFANELTEKEFNNIFNTWELNNETEKINKFNSLVKLGDKKEVALFTVIAEDFNKNSEMYNIAYKS